jgi:hypothetical protein
VYITVAMPSRMTPSPMVNAGVSGRAGLKRNCRTFTSELPYVALLRDGPASRFTAASKSSQRIEAESIRIIGIIHIFKTTTMNPGSQEH